MNMDKDTWSLHLAVSENDFLAVERLIKNGTINPIDPRDEAQQTPLHIAASKGFEVLARVLLGYGANINSVNERGKTPLMLAIENKQTQMAKMLIDRGGADIPIVDRDIQKTSLFLAVETKQLSIVQMLVNRRAKAKTGNFENNTPLHKAILQYHLEMVKLLVNNGAKINVKGDSDASPLHLAVLDDSKFKIVKLLIEKCADLEASDIFEKTPLCHAILNECMKNIQILLEKGANVNTRDSVGATPLHYYFSKDYMRSQMILLLLRHGASLDIQSKTWPF